MLDTSSRANFKPTAETDDLDALAREVSKHLQASAAAAQNFVEHAMLLVMPCKITDSVPPLEFAFIWNRT
jgi:hypothetical protein